MKLSRSMIERVAKNARISLTEKEMDEFVPQCQEILEYFQQLDEVETKNVDPSFQPVKIENVLREDVPKQSVSQEEALSNVKHKKNGYIMGPRAL